MATPTEPKVAPNPRRPRERLPDHHDSDDEVDSEQEEEDDGDWEHAHDKDKSESRLGTILEGEKYKVRFWVQKLCRYTETSESEVDGALLRQMVRAFRGWITKTQLLTYLEGDWKITTFSFHHKWPWPDRDCSEYEWDIVGRDGKVVGHIPPPRGGRCAAEPGETTGPVSVSETDTTFHKELALAEAEAATEKSGKRKREPESDGTEAVGENKVKATSGGSPEPNVPALTEATEVKVEAMPKVPSWFVVGDCDEADKGFHEVTVPPTLDEVVKVQRAFDNLVGFCSSVADGQENPSTTFWLNYDIHPGIKRLLLRAFRGTITKSQVLNQICKQDYATYQFDFKWPWRDRIRSEHPTNNHMVSYLVVDEKERKVTTWSLPPLPKDAVVGTALLRADEARHDLQWASIRDCMLLFPCGTAPESTATLGTPLPIIVSGSASGPFVIRTATEACQVVRMEELGATHILMHVTS